eukprot:TRINITY_DN7812_c1_g1_i1.p1 TRINITY_DN7812_c1_g1~~TRINITY_DN7812_c1_g1_i1.p1  ORF type:complete len:960 (+),score=224.28 TRINITY_DN7812_c1_g1_i1:62-2941(+)
MSDYVKAKNFKAAHKHAVSENLAGGVLQVEVLECSGLVAGDSIGTSDPFVKLIFSSLSNQQQATTEVVNRTCNPVFRSHNKFEFNVVNEVDKLRIEVFDRDLYPLPHKELMAVCETELGASTKAGSDGTLSLYFRHPKGTGAELDGYTPDKHGVVKLRFFYSYSATANTHAAEDITVEQEELEWAKLIDVCGRFSAHLGYMCNPLWYWLETCMWVRPFESAFWCLLIFCSVFLFNNLLSAWFPGLMLVGFLKNYAQSVKAAGRPVVEEEVVPFDWRECARTTQVSLAYYCEMLDWWHAVYAWERPDTAMALTKLFAVWTIAILLLPFPPLRYWFFLFMCYMYILYPMHTNSPRLMGVHMEAVSRWMNAFSLRNFELFVLPHLPEKMQQYVPKSKERQMEAWLESELPPVPTLTMQYDQWKKYNNEREKLKCLMELKKDKFLNENGKPAVPASKGRLEVTVVSSSGFATDDSGSCDPYVQLALGLQTFTTRTKSNTVSPVWNETFEFLEVGHQSGVLSIAVWDKNSFSLNVSLGNCQLKLSQVVRNASQLFELPLIGEKAGPDAVVALMVRGTGPSWPNARQQHLLHVVAEAEEERRREAMKRAPDTRVGTLEVVLMYGAGLKVCDMKTSDPYCQLGLTNHPTNAKPMKSTTKPSTLKPVWNETFTFTSAACKMSLNIVVRDKDKFGKDDDMGMCSVKLNDLFDGEAVEKEVPVILGGKQFGVIAVNLKAHNFGRILPETSLASLASATPASETPAEMPQTAAQTPTKAKTLPLPRETSPSVSPPAVSPPRSEIPRSPPARSPVHSPARVPVSDPPTPQRRTSLDKPPKGTLNSGGVGKLGVTVLSARNLPTSSQSCLVKVLLTEPSFGTKKFKTRPVNAGTTNPVWNVMFTFDALPKGVLAKCRLQVEVWDPIKSLVLAAGVTELHAMQDASSSESWVEVFHEGNPAGEVKLVLAPQGI